MNLIFDGFGIQIAKPHFILPEHTCPDHKLIVCNFRAIHYILYKVTEKQKLGNFRLDVRMVNLAKKSKCTYSRYADDLTFSTNKKDFPASIAIKKDENNWIAGNRLVKEIEKVGFRLNTKKTSMQFKTARQMTTGLIVNEKVNIKREYYKIARSMCHKLFETGEFYICPKDNSINRKR